MGIPARPLEKYAIAKIGHIMVMFDQTVIGIKPPNSPKLHDAAKKEKLLPTQILLLIVDVLPLDKSAGILKGYYESG